MTANPSREREQTAPQRPISDTETHGADAPTHTAAPCPRCVALTAENTRLRQYAMVARAAMGITEEEMNDANNTTTN